MGTGFSNIIGHKDVVEHLTTALELNKVSHAYILNGEKGCGKRTLARTFAKALQCEGEGVKPCGKCASCRRTDNNNHPDIMEVLHEKPNTVSVNDVREKIVADVAIRPYSSRYKVYIVPDCEKMNQEAQNALLKTLEEPPEYVVILLLTTNAEAFLPTILSRCVLLTMKPVTSNLVSDYLMKTVQIPDYQADVCVSFAQGNIGKAVRLATSEQFSEIMAAALHLVTHVREMDIAEITAAVKGVTDFKMEIGDFLDLCALWYRDVLYFKATHDANGILFKEHVRMLREQTNRSSYEGLENILTGIGNAKKRLTANVNFELTMELLFLLIKENS